MDAAELTYEIQLYLCGTGDPELKAWMAYAAGDYGQALVLYAAAIQRAKSRHLHVERGRTSRCAARDSAIAEFELALEEMRAKEYKISSTLQLQGDDRTLDRRATRAADNTAGAREAYGRALQEDLAFFPSHVRLGLLAITQGDTAAALSELETASQVAAMTVGALLVRFCPRLRGQGDAAYEQLIKATELEPLYASPSIIGKIWERRGDAVKAAAAYRAFLVRASSNDPQRALVNTALENLKPYLPTGRLSDARARDGTGHGHRRISLRRACCPSQDALVCPPTRKPHRLRGPPDVQPGPQPDPGQPSRLARSARPDHGGDPGDGARRRSAFVRHSRGAAVAGVGALRASGKLASLPVAFTFVGGTPVVASVAPGSKAARLDIVVGDELIAIDDQSPSAESSEELDLVLSGKPNSVVRLTLERRRPDGTRARVERAVVRQHVDEATAVPVAILLDSITGYLRVTTFANAKVADDLHDAFARLESKGMRRLVLDLRDNGGASCSRRRASPANSSPRGASSTPPAVERRK